MESVNQDLVNLARECAAIEKICRIFPDKIPKDLLDVFLSLGVQAREALAKLELATRP